METNDLRTEQTKLKLKIRDCCEKINYHLHPRGMNSKAFRKLSVNMVHYCTFTIENLPSSVTKHSLSVHAHILQDKICLT
jgi:hypothetical protein